MRLALKAQRQCRATIETLVMAKNPAPVTFVKQANVAHGPQQVNNGPPAEASRARESENRPLVRFRAISGFREHHIGSHIVEFYNVKGRSA
jgi:hypothetical protein